MPETTLDIQNKTNQRVDSIILTNLVEKKYDCYLETDGQNKASVRRPGLANWTTIGALGQSDGAHYWQRKDALFVVGDGGLYKITKGKTKTNLTSGVYLESNIPVTFAEGETQLAMANGGTIKYTTGGNMLEVTDSLAPQKCTHIAYIDGVFVANDAATDDWYFSDTNDVTSWTASRFASANTRGDIIQAIITFQRRIHLFGTATKETWFDDGVNPFSRLDQSFIDRGCVAKNSPVIANNTLYWLDEEKRFVVQQGAAATSVSASFDQALQDLSTVTDCFTYNCTAEGYGWIVLMFPTENRTFVYDYRIDDWYEWSLFDANRDRRNRFLGNWFVSVPEWGVNLVGSREDGQIFTMGSDHKNDAGTKIAHELETGHVDYGTYERKRSIRLNMKLKSGQSGSMAIQWKDDGANEWSQEIVVGLRASGNTDFFYELYRLGVYRSRKWKFRITDNIKSIIGEIKETVDKTGR